MFMDNAMSKATIATLLESNIYSGKWSLQGFGMLRLYLARDKSIRLHVWDSHFKAPGVSVIHDHPWHLESYIVAGQLTNTRYTIDKNSESPNCKAQTIITGVGGGPAEISSERLVRLIQHQPEIYEEGSVYSQRASEVHESQPADGTVTIMKRAFVDTKKNAQVFWPKDRQWVSAEPRPAKTSEVEIIINNALLKWF